MEAHKTVGLLPGREMRPAGNGRAEVGGRSLGKEQMPHFPDGEELTPCSTLLWGEKAVGTPKHNG